MRKKALFVGVFSVVFLASCLNSGKETAKRTETETTVKAGHEKKVNNEVQVGDTTLVYKVSLGVLPDLGYEGEGMKIANVHKDKPASKGGLQNGDIVLEINGDKVEDLVGYTKLLGKYKKDDTVILTYKRGEEMMKTEIKF